jgi:N-acetylneuraminic acid mutarotase
MKRLHRLIHRQATSLFESLESRTLLAAQTPYLASGAASIPGTIEAENFDKGTEGVAYHDNESADLGKGYRSSGVDVQPGGSNRFNVGFVRAGEWLEYTVDVKQAGIYSIDTIVSSGNKGGTFHYEVDGVDKTGPITLPFTNGWGNWKTVSQDGVTLSAGTHVLRLSIDSSFKSGSDVGDIDAFQFIQESGGSKSADPQNSSSSSSSFTTKSLHWKAKATNPLKREEGQSAVYNGKLYEFGGYHDDFQATTRVDRYDPKSNKWSRMRDMPYKITHAAVAPDPDGHSFWFIGGFEGDFKHHPARGPDGTSKVYKYDASGDKWTQMKSLPIAHGAGGAGIFDNKLYFFGGADRTRSHDLSDAYVLDLKHQSNGWKKIASFPNPRNHLGGIAANGKIYAIGGQHHLEDESAMVRELDQYDPATNKWTRMADMPNSLSHFNAATVLYDRYIVTVGGENPHNKAKDYVFAYDTVRNKWTRMTGLPDPRRAGVAGIVGNTLIQSSGYEEGHENSTTWTADLSGVFS